MFKAEVHIYSVQRVAEDAFSIRNSMHIYALVSVLEEALLDHKSSDCMTTLPARQGNANAYCY